MAGDSNGKPKIEPDDGRASCGLRLRPGMAIIPMVGGVQLRAGDEEIFVLETDEPPAAETVLRALAQGNSPADILRHLGSDRGEMLDAVFEQLSSQGLLVERTPATEDEIGRYLSHFDRSPARDIRRPAGPVCVIGHDAAAKLLVQAISEHGIEAFLAASLVTRVASDAAKAAVCVWEHLDPALVLEVNAEACRRRTPCLFVDLSHGCHATVGPFYVPGESSCYACYRERWRQNSAALAEADAAWAAALEQSTEPVPHGILPAFRYQAAGLAVGEVFAFLSRHRPLRTLNRAVTVDFEAVRMWTEPVWRIPWCPTCGAEK